MSVVEYLYGNQYAARSNPSYNGAISVPGAATLDAALASMYAYASNASAPIRGLVDKEYFSSGGKTSNLIRSVVYIGKPLLGE